VCVILVFNMIPQSQAVILGREYVYSNS